MSFSYGCSLSSSDWFGSGSTSGRAYVLDRQGKNNHQVLNKASMQDDLLHPDDDQWLVGYPEEDDEGESGERKMGYSEMGLHSATIFDS